MIGRPRTLNTIIMHSLIEPLESRIAPAAVVTVNQTTHTATWTDFDGDHVTVHWTNNTAPGFLIAIPADSSSPDGVLVKEIQLNNIGDTNDAITVSVKAGPQGDGRVNLGYIDAAGTTLKSFTAPRASVLEFDAGNGAQAIGSLSIASYGTLSRDSFGSPQGDGVGVLNGAVGSVKIAGDLDYGKLVLGGVGTAATNNKVGSVTIGGSLHGDVSQHVLAGVLDLDGPAGTVKIGGSVISFVAGSGEILLRASAAKLGIGGDIVGGSVGQGGPGKTVVSVGGSVIGGSFEGSGRIQMTTIGTLTIGGDVRGGTADTSGEIFVDAATSITVKGSLIGGNVLNPQLDKAAEIGVSANVGAITIGHSLIAGTTSHTDGSTLQVTKNGAILVQGNLGSLSIGGSIEGNNSTRALVVVRGSASTASGNFDGLGKVTVKGSVDYAIIATGHSIDDDFTTDLGNAEVPNSGIGGVTIGGDYYHSSIMAGTNDNNRIGAGPLTGGESDDTQSIGAAGRVAILGPVTIKGALLDDADSFGDSGFEAVQIAKIVVGGVTVFAHGGGTPGALGNIKFFDPGDFVFAEEITAT